MSKIISYQTLTKALRDSKIIAQTDEVKGVRWAFEGRIEKCELILSVPPAPAGPKSGLTVRASAAASQPLIVEVYCNDCGKTSEQGLLGPAPSCPFCGSESVE